MFEQHVLKQLNYMKTRKTNDLYKEEIKELEQFQRQFVDNQIKFSVMGWFDIDNRLMYNLVSAILTFTLLFFPFTLQLINNHTL